MCSQGNATTRRVPRRSCTPTHHTSSSTRSRYAQKVFCDYLTISSRLHRVSRRRSSRPTSKCLFSSYVVLSERERSRGRPFSMYTCRHACFHSYALTACISSYVQRHFWNQVGVLISPREVRQSSDKFAGVHRYVSVHAAQHVNARHASPSSY